MLLDDIPQGAIVGLDTAPFIYYLESHPDYDPLVTPLFESRLEQGLNAGVTSTVSLAEVLVRPLRHGRMDLVAEYRVFLTVTPQLKLLDVTQATAERAGDLRSRYGIRLPDAFQLAAALEEQATIFVTNDAQLRRVTELAVLILNDYLPPAPAPAATGTGP